MVLVYRRTVKMNIILFLLVYKKKTGVQQVIDSIKIIRTYVRFTM